MVRKTSPSIYAIGPQTKAILAKESAYYRARILDITRERHSVYSPEEIIDYTCVLHGSTLEGRRQSVKNHLNVSSKIPIPVIPFQGVYMLPTSSSKSKDNVWLSFYQIAFFEQRDDRTYVEFRDGTGLYVKKSETIMDMQHKRTSQIIAEMCRTLFR